jgi:glycosyltransferase involved in cell wall biosynthesis
LPVSVPEPGFRKQCAVGPSAPTDTRLTLSIREATAVLQLNCPKLLVFAYSCHPTASMESRVGWYRSLYATRRFETFVLYGEDFPEEELAALQREYDCPFPIHFIRVPHSPLMQWLIRVPGCFYLAYSCWQKLAFERALELHAEHDFKLAHQVNFCGYREPGLGWKLPTPFFWGPVGGTHNFPLRFLPATDLGGAAKELFRNGANWLQLRYSHRVQQAASRAARVFAANSTTERDLREILGVRSHRMLEIGIHHIDHNPKPPRDASAPFKILWTGRLHAWKGLPLLLRALAELPPETPFRLRVLGQGPSLHRWQALARRLGIASHIEWLGWPAYRETLPHYRWADAFAFTSLRDTSGAGILEALAAGTPVIGLNHQGLADIIGTDCGIPIPVDSPRRVVASFSKTIMDLAVDPERLALLGTGALQRAEDFSWEELASQMDVHYADYVEGLHEAPEPINVKSRHARYAPHDEYAT